MKSVVSSRSNYLNNHLKEIRIPNRRSQQGVALITAVFIVAISSIIATSLMSRQNFDTLRTANIVHRSQSSFYAIGGNHWLTSVLTQDIKDNKVDHLGEIWAQELPPLPIEGGYIKGKVEDQQGRFNLNSINNAQQEKRFRSLCSLLNIQPQQTNQIIDSLKDWIDTDSTAQPNGAEDVTYLSLELPYRAANQELAHPSELLLVHGVDEKTYQTLKPFITALPGVTDININTAPLEVLQSLGGTVSISKAEAEQIVEYRLSSPYNDINELISRPPLDSKGVATDGLTIQTEYFLLTAEVALGSVNSVEQSLIHRDNKGKIQKLYQQRGQLQFQPPTQSGTTLNNNNTATP